MKIQAENKQLPALTLSKVQWSYIAGLLRIHDANFLSSGIIKPSDFPAARHQLLYAINSNLMLHFASVSFPDAYQLMNNLLIFITECAKTDTPIIWDASEYADFPESSSNKFHMEAGTYVVGDLHKLLNINLPEEEWKNTLIMVTEFGSVYSFPVISGIYSSSEGQQVVIHSTLAIVPADIVKAKHSGIKVVADDDFYMWVDDRNRLNVYDVFFDLGYTQTLETVCE